MRLKNPFLIGERVYLRPLDREDAATLQRFINHPDVRHTITKWRPATIEDEVEFLARVAGSTTEIVLGIVLRADDRLIGSIGLASIDWPNRNAMLGIEIGEIGEWDKGYGREATELLCRHAFDRLNLHRVGLLVYEFNERGRHVYEQLGFREEGRLRESLSRDGRYADTIVMSLLAEEWRAKRGA